MSYLSTFNTSCSLIGLFVCYSVVFKPIFASAKMCINPNAELELKTPKAKLHLEVQNIAIEMTKPQVTSETHEVDVRACVRACVRVCVCEWVLLSEFRLVVCLQYLTMVDLLESINCMVKNAPYRKFRPEVSVHKNTKLWLVNNINLSLNPNPNPNLSQRPPQAVVVMTVSKEPSSLL